ncbi:DUF4141 domain-containing protein [Xanthomonas campestris pv. phormiicola]|nr:DUF4141 domain-containing protein [Xanthomonas campestris pv. phormiicola]UYC16186.1 DUF4141 domain-containing protein [Xanthomonas campestris pv. phormiicola]
MIEPTRRSRKPFSCLATGLLLAAGLCASQANAQWIVHDPTSLGETLKEYAEDAKRWTDTLKQYKDQIAHYQQQLIKLQSLNLTGSTMQDDFTERADDYGMEDACPGGSGSGVTGLVNGFKNLLPNMQGNLVEEQLKVCQQLVLTDNARYNESVRMLKRLIQRNKDFQEKIQAQRNSVGTSQGALAANDNEVSRFMTQNSMDLDYWQAKIKAYDAREMTLKNDQTKLAKRALDGSSSIFGQVVQAAALKTALSVD